MKRLNSSMLTGPLLPNIILYTIPIILTSLLQLLFNAADLVIVGRFCGSISVAAVGATGSITNLMVNFFVGLSVGAGVTVAHALGSREDSGEGNTHDGQKHTADQRQRQCGVDGVVDHSIGPAAKAMSHGDTSTDRQADEEVYHQIGNGTGGTHGSYTDTAAESSYDDQIRCIEEKL